MRRTKIFIIQIVFHQSYKSTFFTFFKGNKFFDFCMEVPRQKPDYEPLQSANFSFH